MNFLAHAYLAGQDADFLTGNLIADAVTAAAYKQMPAVIQAGINHHRNVDKYTDAHPLVADCRLLFFSHIRHYAAVIVDVLFDHYLAKHWHLYHPLPLEAYEQTIYHILDKRAYLFSEKFVFMYSRMKAHRWLSQYQHLTYIRQTIENLNKRTPLFTQSAITIKVFDEQYDEIEKLFFAFFKDLSTQYKVA